jgi:hypothetical protein
MAKDKDIVEVKYNNIIGLGFGIIPRVIMRDKELAAGAKLVFSYLCSFAGTSDKAWPKLNLMVKELGYSRKTLQKYIKELEDKGLITRKQRRENGSQTFGNNIYYINLMPDRYKHLLNDAEGNVENNEHEPKGNKSPTDKPGAEGQNLPHGKKAAAEETPFNNNNNVSNINNNIYTIFELWNKQKITVHRQLSDKQDKAIKKALSNYTVSEICKAIETYAIVVKGKEYYFKYEWRLEEFLGRGLEKFIDREKALKNYRDGRNVPPQPPQKPHKKVNLEEHKKNINEECRRKGQPIIYPEVEDKVVTA